MKQLSNDNAANRASYVGRVYNVGEKTVKEELLASFPSKWSRLHREGYIHIHDLDAYGKTYKNSENSVVSSMVWGSQYDAMMKWMQKRKKRNRCYYVK